MIVFYPTHNHTWHVFAFKASFQHINKKNLRVIIRPDQHQHTPPPSLKKCTTRTKTNHQTNTHLTKNKWDGKIQKTPDPTNLPVFLAKPPRWSPVPKTSSFASCCRPYPPFKLRVDPARSAPHRLVDGKFLAMTCAFSAGKDSRGESIFFKRVEATKMLLAKIVLNSAKG